MADVKRTEEPHDRLTHYAGEMSAVLIAKGDEASDVKAVIMLQDEERGGLVLHGYDDDNDAMVDLLVHVRAIFRANGKDLAFAPFPGKG